MPQWLIKQRLRRFPHDILSLEREILRISTRDRELSTGLRELTIRLVP